MNSSESEVVLYPHGTLSGEDAVALREEARQALTEGKDVVVNLRKVSFADSEGLSALVAAFKTANLHRRQFVLRSVPENLKALLELTRLHRVFTIEMGEETTTGSTHS